MTVSGPLKATSKPRIREDLFTTRTFRDFELVFDWRISPAGNSGVKYRIQDHFFVLPPEPKEKFEASVQRTLQHRTKRRPGKGEDYVVGFEYQLTDDQANPDARSNPKHTAGALYDMVAPATAAAHPAGAFNHSRILLRGNHVEHWINSVKVLEYACGSDSVREAVKRSKFKKVPNFGNKIRGHLLLQDHHSEVWFRNIKLRELPQTAP